MKVSCDKYIFPPRAKAVVPREELGMFADLGWQAQFKVNDSRCLVKYVPGSMGTYEDLKVELWNRHASKMRDYHAPDFLVEELIGVHKTLGLSPNEWSLLDGGLLEKKHFFVKDTVALWDVLVRDGEHLLGVSYEERYGMLLAAAVRGGQVERMIESCPVGFSFSEHVFVSGSFEPSWDWMWERLNETNAPFLAKGHGALIEGLLVKDMSGTLDPGFRERNNGDWQVRSRVANGRHLF